MGDDVSDITPMLDREVDTVLRLPSRPSRATTIKNAITMLVLFMINLLNYMDRMSIAGVLERIQDYFDIGNTEGGLLQTVFVCSYMALAPLFGYLGDRYSRKLMIILGVTLWSLTTLAGSFVPGNHFWAFLLLRGLVGVGEASYSCVAPTIIADLYTDTMRTRMLALFNIAIPLGSGLGYIVGSSVAKAFDDWKWALRVTPVFGAVCILLLIVLVKEPARGCNEGGGNQRSSGWISDMKEIMKIKTFVLTTLGFTWVSFAIGSLAWWGPIFLEKTALYVHGSEGKDAKDRVAFIFGAITSISGILGVILGSEIANRYRRINERGDPLVCGTAVILAMPFLFGVLILSKYHEVGTWILIFIAETLLSSTWALISDILMYIMIPARRATAGSIQIFVMHLLGDASSPYIIGIISDFLKHNSDDVLTDWVTLRNSLMLTPFVATLGGATFLFASFYIIHDRSQASSAAAVVGND